MGGGAGGGVEVGEKRERGEEESLRAPPIIELFRIATKRPGLTEPVARGAMQKISLNN